MKVKIPRWINFLFKLIITVLAIYIVINNIDLTELWENIKKLNLFYLFFAFIAFICSKIIEALRINNYYRAIQVYLKEIENIKLYMLGLFYNLFLPGGISGDGYKVYWIKKYKSGKLQHIIWATLINRLNGFLGILILIVGTVYLSSVNYPYKPFTGLLIPVMYGGFYLAVRLFFSRYASIIWKTTIQSVIIQVLQLLAVHFIIINFAGIANYFDYYFIFLASSIAFVIPVTLGGFGSREVVFVYAADYMPIDAGTAVAMSLIIYFIRTIVSFMGVYYLIYPERIFKHPRISALNSK